MPRSKSRPLPTIDEIKTVIADYIQTLIESFAVPDDKSAARMKRGGVWKPSEVQSPEIRREIACLQRAIQLLNEIQELDFKALAKAIKDNESSVTPVPRGTSARRSMPSHCGPIPGIPRNINDE